MRAMSFSSPEVSTEAVIPEGETTETVTSNEPVLPYSDIPEDELTPYQKGARTKAYNIWLAEQETLAE